MSVPPPQPSADNRARDKRPCPACGGDLVWDARRLAFACPYCGEVVGEAPASSPAIAPDHEHDLEAALANPVITPTAATPKELVCPSCHAVTLFQPNTVAQRCDFCGAPALQPREAQGEAILPQAVLPFTVPESRVRELLRGWYGSRWFAPNRLKHAALTDTLKGVYLPYWTFDAEADARWQAESGDYYYTGTGQNRKRKVRWRWTSGALSHTFDDLLVCGSVGVHEGLLQRIEPFPTLTDLKPYAEEYLRGWVVERAQRALPDASAIGRDRMLDHLRQLCAAEVPGDTHRNLTVQAQFTQQRFKHVLLPVWLVTYRYGQKSYQVLANGYTGALAGEHPLSWIKITLAVLALLTLVMGVVWFSE